MMVVKCGVENGRKGTCQTLGGFGNGQSNTRSMMESLELFVPMQQQNAPFMDHFVELLASFAPVMRRFEQRVYPPVSALSLLCEFICYSLWEVNGKVKLCQYTFPEVHLPI
jgi:hypothetical protein